MVSAIRLGADTQIHTQMPAGLNISAHQEKLEEEKGEEKEETLPKALRTQALTALTNLHNPVH